MMKELGISIKSLLKHALPTDSRYHQLLWRRSWSIDSSFCRAVVRAGYLTWQQMLDAVCRYRLGAIHRNAVIFWQIMPNEEVMDGKVMYYGPDCHRLKDKKYDPNWVSALLTRRHGGKSGNDITRHCLFGLHLLRERHPALILPMGADGSISSSPCKGAIAPEEEAIGERSDGGPERVPQRGGGVISSDVEGVSRSDGGVLCSLPPVAVVEAEKTAVILSARYPQYLWLATGGLFEVQPEKFRPLRGRRVVLFPDTDPDGKAYSYWYNAAQMVMAQPYWEGSPPIRVSALLEQQATPEQKRRKIDLVDFIFEGIPLSRYATAPLSQGSSITPLNQEGSLTPQSSPSDVEGVSRSDGEYVNLN